MKKMYVGNICKSVSETFNKQQDSVILINTSDILNGKILNNKKEPNNNLKGQFKKTFKTADILYSEIRPANKRFAFVSEENTKNYVASTKLMVIRAFKEFVVPKYLYLYLTSSEIVNKLQQLAESRSGTFPQITFSEEISNLVINLPSQNIQNKIVDFISSIDNKIEVNAQINKNLEEQAQSIFSKIINKSSKFVVSLSEIAMLNPRRILSKGKIARYIDMSQLSTSTSFPSGWDYKKFNGGMRFCNGDTLLARITPCLENGKTAYVNFLDDKEVAFGSTEYIVMCSKGIYPNEFFYCLARYSDFVDYAVKNMNGSSGRQRVSAEIVGKYELPKINDSDLQEFMDIVPNLFNICRTNNLENMNLEKIRDTLLPRLMSGEIDVSKLGVG